MPRVVVQTDDGTTAQIIEYPLESIYALDRMPGCPSHIGLHNFLGRLKRALGDAGALQEHGNVPQRLSERVMAQLEGQSYKIVRYYRQGHPYGAGHRIVQTGLSFKEARDHVAGPEGQGAGWHDTYEAE